MSEQIYKCPCCGAEADELPMIKQLLGEFYCESADYTCRCCGKEDYDTASKCKICGEWTCDSELYDNHEVCKKCAESIQTFYKAFRKKLSEAEWDYLVSYMEERNFE